MTEGPANLLHSHLYGEEVPKPARARKRLVSLCDKGSLLQSASASVVGHHGLHAAVHIHRVKPEENPDHPAHGPRRLPEEHDVDTDRVPGLVAQETLSVRRLRARGKAARVRIRPKHLLRGRPPTNGPHLRAGAACPKAGVVAGSPEAGVARLFAQFTCRRSWSPGRSGGPSLSNPLPPLPPRPPRVATSSPPRTGRRALTRSGASSRSRTSTARMLPRPHLVSPEPAGLSRNRPRIVFRSFVDSKEDSPRSPWELRAGPPMPNSLPEPAVCVEAAHEGIITYDEKRFAAFTYPVYRITQMPSHEARLAPARLSPGCPPPSRAT